MWGDEFMRGCIFEVMKADQEAENEREAARLIHYASNDHALTMIAELMNSGKIVKMNGQTFTQRIVKPRSNVGQFDQKAINAFFA